MKKSICIPYGNKNIQLKLPENVEWSAAKSNEAPPASDITIEIESALNNPIGSKRIEDIVSPGQRVCIISDDITRPTPVKEILEVLLPRLEKAGISKKDIFIVMALGSHRYMTEQEMINKVSKDIYNTYSVYNSEFKDPNGLMDMGCTPTGASVRATKRIMDSDVRIGIGNILPHPAMGWSGGGKILYPGVTSEDTVEQFHMKQGLANEILFGMDECPVRLEVEKWVDTIGLHFIINTVLTADLKLYKAVSGHYIKAHRRGVEYAKTICGAKVSKSSKVVVVSSYPVDIDYWQATKGYLCGARAAMKGGTIILVTPCYEGVGPHEEYLDCIGDDKAEEKLLSVQRGEDFEGDMLAMCVGTCVMKIRRKYNLVTVGDGLTAQQLSRAKIKHYSIADLNQAVEDACSRYENPDVLAIPHGGETVIYK